MGFKILVHFDGVFMEKCLWNCHGIGRHVRPKLRWESMMAFYYGGVVEFVVNFDKRTEIVDFVPFRLKTSKKIREPAQVNTEKYLISTPTFGKTREKTAEI